MPVAYFNLSICMKSPGSWEKNIQLDFSKLDFNKIFSIKYLINILVFKVTCCLQNMSIFCTKGCRADQFYLILISCEASNETINENGREY